MQQLTFLSAEPPVRTTRSRASERAWLEAEGNSPSHFLKLLHAIAPSGSFGKMSPASSVPMAERTSLPSSGTWGNSGMGGPTGFLTLSMSEHSAMPAPFPSDGGVSSLSDILETGDHLRRYSLTPKACAGILRRAEGRGKDLPPQLARALRAVADSAPTSTSTGG